MNLLIHRWKREIMRKLASFWYWSMKPLATYLYNRDNENYRKQKEKMTEDEAIRYIAEDIAKYIVNGHKGYEMSFIIADFFDEDQFMGYDSLRNLRLSIMKRKKTKIGYYKLNRDVRVQMAIIEKLKTFKGIVVVEEVESFTWQRISNYQKTCHISYR